MFCKHCGAEITFDKAKFCSKCGKPIDYIKPSEPEPLPADAQPSSAIVEEEMLETIASEAVFGRFAFQKSADEPSTEEPAEAPGRPEFDQPEIQPVAAAFSPVAESAEEEASPIEDHPAGEDLPVAEEAAEAPAFAAVGEQREAAEAPAFAAVVEQREAAAAPVFSAFEVAASEPEPEENLMFAEGLPEWSICPPDMPIMRKRSSLR